jgi:hypothetical protein
MWSPNIPQRFSLVKRYGTNYSLFKKCNLISCPDVVTNFTGWWSGKGVYLYLVGVNLCRGTKSEFLAAFLIPPCNFRYSASKSYDIFLPCHSNPSFMNKSNIGVAYLELVTTF